MLLLLNSTETASGQNARPRCFIDVPVYDAVGAKKRFSIVAAMPEIAKHLDLLTIDDIKYRAKAEGQRLYFPHQLIGSRARLTLKNPEGQKTFAWIAFLDCQQRASVQYGTLDSGDDVASTIVTGQLKGCQQPGDWWVRVIPMFGGHEGHLIHEGYIDPPKGVIRIASTIIGGRHILIIGRGPDPVYTTALNITAGAKNDLGVVDLRSHCPK